MHEPKETAKAERAVKFTLMIDSLKKLLLASTPDMPLVRNRIEEALSRPDLNMQHLTDLFFELNLDIKLKLVKRSTP